MQTRPFWRVCKPIEWGSVLAFLLFAQIAATAGASAATLPELFPSLADLPDANGVGISLGWQGLSPVSPIQATYLLRLHGDQFEGQGQFRVATATAARDISVPHDLVRRFLAAAIRVPIAEREYQPRFTHTDDYPSVAIIVQARQSELSIETRSQPQITSEKYWDATPWAIHYSGRTFVVTADDLDRALAPILPSLRYDEVSSELAKKVRSSPEGGR